MLFHNREHRAACRGTQIKTPIRRRLTPEISSRTRGTKLKRNLPSSVLAHRNRHAKPPRLLRDHAAYFRQKTQARRAPPRGSTTCSGRRSLNRTGTNRLSHMCERREEEPEQPLLSPRCNIGTTNSRTPPPRSRLRPLLSVISRIGLRRFFFGRELLYPLADSIQDPFQETRLVAQVFDLDRWRHLRRRCGLPPCRPACSSTLPAGQSGGVKPVSPPTSATTSATAPAEPESGSAIHVSRDIKPGTATGPATGHRILALRTPSVSHWHIELPFHISLKFAQNSLDLHRCFRSAPTNTEILRCMNSYRIRSTTVMPSPARCQRPSTFKALAIAKYFSHGHAARNCCRPSAGTAQLWSAKPRLETLLSGSLVFLRGRLCRLQYLVARAD